MKPYYALTVRGQARRLRPLALAALRQYPLDVTRLSLVTNDFNGIFRVETRDSQKFILRVTLPQGGHDRVHVAAEMAWLEALSYETELSVPRPVLAKDGSLVVEAADAGVPEARLCAVFSWVPGTDLARHITTGNIAKLGELMAKLHVHSFGFRPPPGLSLLSFDRVFPFPEPVVLFEQRYASLFSTELRQIYEQSADWAQQAVDRLIASEEPMRILHGDLHQWNVRIYRGVLSPIDFEDLMWGWPVQDIATTLYDLLRLDEYQALRSAFLRGYTRVSPWPERYPGEVDAFMAARALGLANFVLNDLSSEWQRQTGEFIERTGKRLCLLLQGRPV